MTCSDVDDLKKETDYIIFKKESQLYFYFSQYWDPIIKIIEKSIKSKKKNQDYNRKMVKHGTKKL